MPPWGGERQRRARQRREAPTLNPGRGTAVCAPFGRRSRRPGPQGASAPSTCSPRRPREYDAGHRAVLLEHEQSGCQGHDEQKYDHQQREPSRPCLTLPAARSRLRAGVTHGGCHQLSPLWWLVCSASSRRAMAVDGRGQVPDAAPRAQRALSGKGPARRLGLPAGRPTAQVVGGDMVRRLPGAHGGAGSAFRPITSSVPPSGTTCTA